MLGDGLGDNFYLAPHQPSRRTLEGIVHHNRLDPNSVYIDGIRHGNVTGASALMALQSVHAGKLDQHYDRTMLFGFGIDNLVAAAALRKI
jgi:3-oxoacyl-[acyl-carrier-protein] synthase III